MPSCAARLRVAGWRPGNRGCPARSAPPAAESEVVSVITTANAESVDERRIPLNVRRGDGNAVSMVPVSRRRRYFEVAASFGFAGGEEGAGLDVFLDVFDVNSELAGASPPFVGNFASPELFADETVERLSVL